MEKAFIFQKIFAISYCGRAHQKKLRMRFLMHLLIFLQLKKINFLLNYHCAEEEEINAEKKIVLTFHPEVIINGKRLINDFPDVDLNRRFILLEEGKVQDITYQDCGVKSEPVLFGEACRQVCEKTFASLDKYFNVDYNVSLVFGTAKREYTGLAPEVRKALAKKF